MAGLRNIIWVGSALKDLKMLPTEVKDEIGFTLHQIQEGKTPSNTKPLKGFGSGVMEIVCDFDTNTYRAIYAIKIGDEIYALHAFQKKSKTGIKTPQKEIDLIEQRLKIAKQIAVSKG